MHPATNRYTPPQRKNMQNFQSHQNPIPPSKNKKTNHKMPRTKNLQQSTQSNQKPYQDKHDNLQEQTWQPPQTEVEPKCRAHMLVANPNLSSPPSILILILIYLCSSYWTQYCCPSTCSRSRHATSKRADSDSADNPWMRRPERRQKVTKGVWEFFQGICY